MVGVGDIDTLIAAGSLDVASSLLSAPTDFGLDEVRVLPPVARPGKILCVGVNYPERNEEYKDGSTAPAYPSLFVRFASSLVADGQSIVRPRESSELDYEGELAVVIGRTGRRIPPEAAWDHLFGVTIANDGTLRDWVRHGKFNVTQGKNFDCSGSIGPWVSTLDEFPTRTWQITTRVNGDVRQDDSTARMIFPIPALVAYISAFCTLEPGDLILTGTPSGAGGRLTPPRYLEPGDEIAVGISGVGTLRNRVIAEPQIEEP
jgi:2-keto-4-pentenoate hydratase/2-oxohepta-3-ene-1,7-dioic acid hydratase in catechol pathway